MQPLALTTGKAGSARSKPSAAAGSRMALERHRLANRSVAAVQHTPLVRPAGREQPPIERQVRRLGDRDPVVAPEVAVLALDPPFSCPAAGAELRLEAPVRAEGDEPDRLLAPVAAQTLRTALARLS